MHKLMIPKWTNDQLMESSVPCYCFYQNFILDFLPNCISCKFFIFTIVLSQKGFMKAFKVPRRSVKTKICQSFYASFRIGPVRIKRRQECENKLFFFVLKYMCNKEVLKHNKNQIFLLLVYITKILILKIWMIFFFFAANDL